MTDVRPWYDGGLRFSCTMCGECCTGEAGFVWVTPEEIARIAEILDAPLDETEAIHTRQVGHKRSLREKSNGDCVFYDGKAGCTIYEARPEQCRTWPFWKSNVTSVSAWEMTCHECPGAGQGELISAEEITQRMARTTL